MTSTDTQPTSPAAAGASTVTRIYAAFGRGDVPAILDRLAEDVAWKVLPRNAQQISSPGAAQPRSRTSSTSSVAGRSASSGYRTSSDPGVRSSRLHAEFDLPGGGRLHDEGTAPVDLSSSSTHALLVDSHHGERTLRTMSSTGTPPIGARSRTMYGGRGRGSSFGTVQATAAAGDVITGHITTRSRTTYAASSPRVSLAESRVCAAGLRPLPGPARDTTVRSRWSHVWIGRHRPPRRIARGDTPGVRSWGRRAGPVAASAGSVDGNRRRRLWPSGRGMSTIGLRTGAVTGRGSTRGGGVAHPRMILGATRCPNLCPTRPSGSPI
jgi:uncharacterized protein